MGSSTTSREVICCSCKHQFRAIFRADDPWRVKSKDGAILEVDLAQCPQCGKFLYLTHDSLTGLDSDEYEPLEFKV